jgi:competence protein ComEC
LALALPAPWRRRGLTGLCALSLAFGWNWLYARQVQAPLEALAGTEQTVTMTLCDYAAPTDYGAKVTVRLAGYPLGRAVYYGDETLLDLRPGQTVTDLAALSSAARIRDDDITTFTSKGVFLLAYNRGEPEVGEGTMDSPRWWPVRAGEALRRQITALWGEGDTGAFLTAILTGDKSGLSEAASSDLSEAGLYHILAVSGLHCGFLLALGELLAGRHRRRLLAAVTLPALVFYALLTGAVLGGPGLRDADLLVAAPLFRRREMGSRHCAPPDGYFAGEPLCGGLHQPPAVLCRHGGHPGRDGRLYRCCWAERGAAECFASQRQLFRLPGRAGVHGAPQRRIFGYLVLVSP